MWTIIICLVFGFCAGIAVTLGSWIAYDNRKDKKRQEWYRKMREALSNSEFCIEGCGYYESCYSQNEDPDDANDILVNRYCCYCPISEALHLMDEVID